MDRPLTYRSQIFPSWWTQWRRRKGKDMEAVSSLLLVLSNRRGTLKSVVSWHILSMKDYFLWCWYFCKCTWSVKGAYNEEQNLVMVVFDGSDPHENHLSSVNSTSAQSTPTAALYYNVWPVKRSKLPRWRVFAPGLQWRIWWGGEHPCPTTPPPSWPF